MLTKKPCLKLALCESIGVKSVTFVSPLAIPSPFVQTSPSPSPYLYTSEDENTSPKCAAKRIRIFNKP